MTAVANFGWKNDDEPTVRMAATSVHSDGGLERRDSNWLDPTDSSWLPSQWFIKFAPPLCAALGEDADAGTRHLKLQTIFEDNRNGLIEEDRQGHVALVVRRER